VLLVARSSSQSILQTPRVRGTRQSLRVRKNLYCRHREYEAVVSLLEFERIHPADAEGTRRVVNHLKSGRIHPVGTEGTRRVIGRSEFGWTHSADTKSPRCMLFAIFLNEFGLDVLNRLAGGKS
jgi:hypothetical protein